MIFLSLIIIVTAISMQPIIEETDRKMNKIKADSIAVLEKSINYEISYSSISPSIFSFISIKNLVIYKDKQKTVKLADIQSFKVFYSPFYFFTKAAISTPLQGVKRFDIKNATVYINQQRDKTLLSLFSSNNRDDSTISLLPLKTVFSGKNIEILLETDFGTIIAEDLFVSMIPDNESYKTRIDGRLNLELSKNKSLFKNFNSSLSIKGSVGEFFESLNFIVKTKGFKSNVLEIEDQTFQVISAPDEILIRKVQDNSPIDLALRYDRVLKDLVVNFNAEDFQPDSIVKMKSSLNTYKPYMSSFISGNGSLLINKGNSALYYSLDSEIVVNRDIFNRDILISADLTGDLNQINIRSVRMKTKEGLFLFTGDVLAESFFPSGTLTFKNVQTPNGYTINSTVNVERDSGFLHFTSDSVNLGTTRIEGLNLVLLPEKDFLSASLKAQISDEKGRVGHISADSLLYYSNARELVSYINLKDIPSGKILQLLPENINSFPVPEDFLQSSLSSDIYLSADLKGFNAQINKLQITSDSDPENHLSFSAFYSETGFKVNDMYLSWNDYNLNGYINSIKDKGEYIITTDFDLQERPYRLQAIYNGEQMLLEGDYGLFGFIQNTKEGVMNFKLSSNQFPIPFPGYLLYADLNLSGYYSSLSDWKVLFENTSVNTGNFYTLPSPEVRFTAEADDEGLDFYNLQYNDNISALKGLGRITYGRGELNSWLSLLDETGKTDEQYDLFFVMNKGIIESRLSVTSSPLERLRESGLSGQLSADLAFTGTALKPDINAVFHTDRMIYNGVPVEISSFVRGDKNVIRISDLELNYNGIMFNRGLVLFELNKGKLLATGAINQIVNNSRISTSITTVVKADNSFDLYSLDKLNTSQLQGQITIAPVIWDGMKTFPPIKIVLNKDRSLLTARIDGGQVFDSSYNIDNGEITMAVKELFPLRFTAGGSIRDYFVNMEVEDLYFDPGFINYFMPVDPFQDKRHVVFKDGSITGDVIINGRLTDPSFNGVLNVNDIQVESPYLKEAPLPASTTAYLEGHSMRLDPLVVGLKNGEIDIQSSFEFDGALPTTYIIDVNITGGSGARVAYEIPSFSWDGHFSGSAHIEGSKQGGFLKGDLICHDLDTSLESDAVLGAVKVVQKNPSVNGFLVDLKIQTGREVNFYLPNKKVPIIQATADNGGILNITYDSRSDTMALLGKIDIRTGEINYFNKTFFLQEGYIDFNESQVNFNPWLNVSANVVTKDDLGDSVTISLLYDDFLFNEFKPKFMSFPGKTENEILALLGQSFIPSNDPDNFSVASLLVATGGMIGKNTIMQPFEEVIKSSLKFDFVSFNTNIIENAILDRFQNQEYYHENRQSMNIARYLENTSLFVGEYIGDYLFLEASLVLDYDEFHSVSSPMDGLEFVPNLNLQFITPFVLIDWAYSPLNNPDSDYFLPHNSVTFTWQYSY